MPGFPVQRPGRILTTYTSHTSINEEDHGYGLSKDDWVAQLCRQLVTLPGNWAPAESRGSNSDRWHSSDRLN